MKNKQMCIKQKLIAKISLSYKIKQQNNQYK